MTWHVYRLIDPRTGKPFYVGCTTVPRDRFQVHVDDPAVAARSRCQELRSLGLHPKLKIVRAFDGKWSAYDFACRLILTTRGLVNAPLEFFRWPSRSERRPGARSGFNSIRYTMGGRDVAHGNVGKSALYRIGRVAVAVMLLA
jgi:hypothetical protein